MRNRRTSRNRPVVIWAIVVALIAGGFWYLWQQGGEQPQTRVEKIISPDRFAQ